MSSLKDLASLIMIPSLVKDGRLDTVKPLGNSIIHPDATGNNDGTDGSTPPEGNFTFSRGSNLAATRVDVNGLIEKGRENLLLQSNQFDTTWTNTNTTETGGQNGYDGTNNAWLLTKTASSFARIQQPITSTSGVKTFSVYLKAGTLSWCRVLAISSASPEFYINLSNGSLGSQYNNITATSTDVGNGWYRVSLVFNDTISEVRIYPADANNSVSGISGSIYIQDAQLEQGLVPTDYIETGASTAQAGILEDLPRLDYSGGASCPSLLLEPQRTNMFSHSEYFGGTPYQTRVIITDNAIVSPEGVSNAAKLVATTANGSHGVDYIPNVIAASYSMSVYAKAGETSKFVLLTNNRGSNIARGFDVSNGTTFASDLGGYSEPTSYSITEVGNDWYYCTIQFSKTSSGGSGNGITLTNADGQHSFTGNGTDGMYFYGWQMEQGSYPTSYIPTYGSAVTRSKENSYKSSISDLIGQEQGTLFAEVDISHLDGTTARDLFFLSNTDNVSDDWIGIGFSGVGSNTLRGRIVDSGSLKFDQYGTITSTGRYKIALAYENGNGAFYVNGVSFGTNYVNTNFSLTLDRVFNAPVSFSSQFADDINQLLLFKTRLTNAELAALTTI